MLSTQDPEAQGYLDVPNKLFMIKHGHIFAKGLFPSLFDLNAEVPDSALTHEDVDEERKIQVSKDQG